MSNIRPFKGLRALPELVKEISALPYDVMNTEEARAILKENPLSFLSVTKSEATMAEGVDEHSQAVYERAKDNLAKYIANGQMKQDATPCYYIYRQQMGASIQIGLVAAASVEEYRDNIIKKHELTRTDKEQDRVNHIMTTRAQTGCVFLAYKNRGEIDALLIKYMSNHKPVYDFVADDGIKHTLYVVSEPLKIAEITELFAQVPCMYIADGHHRSAAALRVADALSKRPEQSGKEEYNSFLSVIFPDNMLHILDYNRLVKDLNGFTISEFMSRLEEKFIITETVQNPKPQKRHNFGMYIAGKWYVLEAKEETFAADNPIASLDVSVLQENLLCPVLDIKDPRTDSRIGFVGGIRGLKELEKKVNNGEYSVAFAMYPTSMEELMTVADQGLIMPPKSTWFEPKLRDAMVVHLIGDAQ
ncbi:MAG: DUF1015 family protein [Acidaminococcaceae bacterium]|nr:DUF1015 family protein [Acidaminococcaceae bacterium]